MPSRRLKILRSSRLGGVGCFFLLSAEIFEVRLAIAAADGLKMKIDVLGMPAVERGEQVTAELLACWARQALPPPDFAHAVYARIAAGVDRRKLLEQLRLFAQLRFNRRHF